MNQTKQKTHAGGWGAIASSLYFLKREGFFKGIKTLLKVNQSKGFDCPGCAWGDADPSHRTIAEFCENGVKAVAYEATHKKANAKLFARYTVSELNELGHFEISNQGRLVEPLAYSKATDKYEPIAWEDAFTKIGSHLKALASPNDAIFYTSGRTSNEAAFLYQLFGRAFGTNNFPDCSNMCHESSGVALQESIGIGKGTVSIEDFHKAELIIIMGQNPGTNHPRMLAELEQAVKNGAKIISINPMQEVGLKGFLHPQNIPQMLANKPTKLASHYYSVRLGSDMALVQAVIHYILTHHGAKLDDEFIATHTDGFEAYKQSILEKDWATLVEQSSLSESEVVQIATLYLNSEKTICCWAMGLTQHKHGVYTIQEIVNLLLIKGNIGKEGAGACPVRGHSNVQGDRTVGITEAPKEEFLQKIEQAFTIDAPRKHGFNVIEAIEAMSAPTNNGTNNKVFVSLGGNFAAAAPDSEATHTAMKNCNLSVYISTHLNKGHLICGKESIILPCLGRTEIDMQQNIAQEITVEDSMSMVHSSKGGNLPISLKLKSEVQIIANIASATLGNTQINFQDLASDYSKIRQKIQEVLPAFNGYNDKIKQDGGFWLKNTATTREWQTPTQKANFSQNPLPDLTLAKNHLAMMTIRSHDQFNTTIYNTNDRYRGIKNDRQIIFMNPSDIASLGLKNGERVNISSHSKDNIKRSVQGFKIVSYDIKQGCAATYYPEANPLVSRNDYADKSYTPAYKFVDITVNRE